MAAASLPESAPPSGRAPLRSGHTVASQLLRLLGVVLATGAFVAVFDHERNQWAVNALYLGAIALWVWTVRAATGGPLLAGLPRPAPADWWLLAGLLAAFAACWLPFYGNWRWAYTGDSISFFGSGYYLYHRGLRQSLLSMRGIDNFYTYLWEVTYNLGVFLFGPTLFGHRFGLFVMACLALAATWAFYAAVWGRWWAAAVVVATASNHVWIFFSYVSYQRMDGIVFYNLALFLGLLIWRQPDRTGLYLLLGVLAGLSLFFTPVVWSCVGVVCTAVGVRAVAARRTLPLAALVGSAVLVAVPVLQELPWFVQMLRAQSVETGRPLLPDAAYVWRILRQIVWAPVDSPIEHLGAHGAFFRGPLRLLYPLGLGLAALALFPPARRRLRLPAPAGPLVLLLLWDALLLALTNKNYGAFSHKRSYVLLPPQTFVALLPLHTLWNLVRERPVARRATVAAAGAVLALSAVANLGLLLDPAPGTYGANAYDGLIELHQRHAPRSVVLLTSREMVVRALQPDELFHLAYGVRDRLTVSQDFSPATVETACARGALICHEPHADRDRVEPLLATLGDRVRPFPLLNSHELVCAECTPAPAAP